MEEEVSYSHPSPTETPYRTPSSSRSRQSRPFDMSPPSSPPPLPSDERPSKRRSHDSMNHAFDESISPLDPRRITPTLHASLVGEILSLRRDLENKSRDITQLELSLHSAQSDNERLNEDLSASNKETRSLKRQMQLLEGGTLSALSEIANERDVAFNDRSDLQKKLEQSQKRARNHEEDANRTREQWDRARDAWAAEKRGLETKVNIVEGRLKVVVNEVAKAQQASSNAIGTNSGHFRQGRGGSGDSPSRRPVSALSQRRRNSGASNASDHFGGRASAMGIASGQSTSLADELALDEEDEDEFDLPDDGRVSPDALPEERDRPVSRMSIKAHKVLGLDYGVDETEALDHVDRQKAVGVWSSGLRHGTAQHVDVGVQYSPPPSPKFGPSLAISQILSTELLPVQPVDTMSPESAHTNKLTPLGIPIDFTRNVESERSVSHGEAQTCPPLMISTSCQTIESLPSPPPTPQVPVSVFVTPSEEVPDYVMTVEWKNSSTQTEAIEEEAVNHPRVTVEHVRQLLIPTIAIIPPGSRPATPETHVVLPPRTKNASCQVSMQSYPPYRSASMQTEEIRIDRRPIDLPPLPTSSIFGQYKPPIISKAIPPNSSRRRFHQTTPTPLAMHDSKRKGFVESLSYPPNNDGGPLVKDFASNIHRPVRSSSLFAGFDEPNEDGTGELDDEPFDDDDIFSRPTAKFTLRFGKLVSQDNALADIGELAAADAGEAVALENLRMSEDSLPAEIRVNLPTRTSPRKRTAPYQPRGLNHIRRVPSPKRSIRRTALISSGAAAHSAQSSLQSQDLVTPTDPNPPPFPVPTRFSSKKPGKSLSEHGRHSPTSSAASPSKREKNRSRKPLLRKVRSGPAISPGPSERRQRSQSPPTNPRVSIVPDMPSFQMPVNNAPVSAYPPSREASAPRPSVATGPNRKVSHSKTNSDAVSMQQTSVVDAITQTMIGEWMFKYVRRRKSFGMPDTKATDWDPNNKNVDELSANGPSTGVRHKRWVWLAPYERSVMWSSKQPMSGSALLGKSGRKLTIQSVLDVKDDNPMPKGSIPESARHFNRSILILTPQRALKFTATTQERHYVWLTALSFLSHSPLSLGDLALPPPPSADGNRSLPPPSLAGSSSLAGSTSLAGSLRRRPIRDSIRIAKSAGRQGLRSFTTDGSLPVQVPNATERDRFEEQIYYDPSMDAALPPTIPRFSAHTRKRSNTGPRAPPTSFRTLMSREKEPVPSMPTSGVASTYSQSVVTTATGTGVGSERGLYTPSLGMKSSGSKSSSRRGSEPSAMDNRPNFATMNMGWDNGNQGNGTMRMDAFMETNLRGKGVGSYRTRNGRKKDLGYWGVDESHQRRQDEVEEIGMGFDLEDMLLPSRPGDIFGSTRLSPEIEVGGMDRDPFRGF